jgi:hypothetical protein
MSTISKPRLVLIHLLIAGVVGGSLYDILRRQEHWPFSNYPMFARVHQSRTLSWYRLFGVTTDNREVPIVDHTYLWPLDQSRLPIGLRAVYQAEGNGPRLHDAVADALRRYELRRQGGWHKGPELRGMRLYSVDWQVVPYATNLDHPASRTLLVDVAREDVVQ